MSHIRVAIAGASGRMGKQLIQAANQSAAVRLSVVIVRPGSGFTGCDAGELAGCGLVGVTVADNLQTVADQFDVLIDFTRPEATPDYLVFCQQYKKGMVIGTTGFDQAGKAAIRQAAKSIPVVFAANFSVGVNLMLNLLRQASRVMGHYADIEIVEAHHRHKVDAPSGTALAMGETIADTMGWRLDKHAVYAREGHTGERRAESIGFATIRAGNIVGEHTAIFADMGEQVEITHKAYDRMTFAKGAVLAASWLKGRNCGLFSMSDVLGL